MGERGSSPLARGLLEYPPGVSPSAGIIPARAGFTAPAHGAGPRFPDHPRSRGVYWNTPRGYPQVQGSSPLARGLLIVFMLLRFHRGIIPARAGFTLVLLGATMSERDHPRSRGVYRGISLAGAIPRGSSPLARGLRSESPEEHPTLTDHPRSRGVYLPALLLGGRGGGSSPLARGLLPVSAKPEDLIRIIPARAGFTSFWSS